MNAGAAALDEMGGSDTSVFALSIVDPPPAAADAYPIAGFTYIAFDAGRLDCVALHDVVYLIYWAWTAPQAIEIARRHGVVPISPALTGALITAMKHSSHLQCKGGVDTLSRILLEVTPRCAKGAQRATSRHAGSRLGVAHRNATHHNVLQHGNN
jgi:hypothetical protein